MRRMGITVGLGTDGEKENNNLDMVEETEFASLLQKVSTLDPTTGDPWEPLDRPPPPAHGREAGRRRIRPDR